MKKGEATRARIVAEAGRMASVRGLGAVSLNQGGNVVNGGRLVINLDTGRAVIDGSAVGGGAVQSSGGRVTGRFSVPKRD